jgi:hypothetical protein
MDGNNTVSHSPNASTQQPILSLILCTRNDQYMGNSRWRLQTTLNYIAQNVHTFGQEQHVEVIVTDWGSEVPLREVVQLSPVAAKIVSFLHVPPETARPLQKDSPFPEVLALNAAARRVRGQYIGRIDQDTIVGTRFLKTFLDMSRGVRKPDAPLETTLWFASRRSIPYRFAVRCPSFWAVDRYLHWFQPLLRVEHPIPLNPFYYHDVGIWLVHRDIWHECEGYNEKLIYMNVMEIEMISRLIEKYKMMDLGKIVNYDFYHLDHYHPWKSRSSTTHRKENPFNYREKSFKPNGEKWGLIQYPLELLPVSPNNINSKIVNTNRSISDLSRFILLFLRVGPQIAGDVLMPSIGKVGRIKQKRIYHVYFIWKSRIRTVRKILRGQRLLSWPRILTKLLIEKRLRRI